MAVDMAGGPSKQVKNPKSWWEREWMRQSEYSNTDILDSTFSLISSSHTTVGHWTAFEPPHLILTTYFCRVNRAPISLSTTTREIWLTNGRVIIVMRNFLYQYLWSSSLLWKGVWLWMGEGRAAGHWTSFHSSACLVPQTSKCNLDPSHPSDILMFSSSMHCEN